MTTPAASENPTSQNGTENPPPPPTTPASDAPSSAPGTSSAPPPNRGGRPKGATDKRPRKRKNPDAVGMPGAKVKPKKKADPAATFAAPVAGETARVASSVSGTPEKPTVNVAAIVDPKELADSLLVGGSDAVSLIASMRYPEAWCEILKLSEKEREVLSPLLGASFAASGVNMSPGDAFLVIFGLMMGTKLLILEKEFRKQRRSAGTTPSPLDERAPATPAAA